MAIKKSLGKLGSRFAFEFLIETFHGEIIQGFKKALSDISPKDIPARVRKGQFPPFEHLDFSAAGDNIKHIQRISLLRFMEFFAEARPDLATAVQDMGETGAEYMVKLRAHLLERIGQPAGDMEFKPQEDTVMVHCDKCDKKWPVKKEEAEAITVCPFCSPGGDEVKESPSEDE